MEFPPPHLSHEPLGDIGNSYWKKMIMGGNSVNRGVGQRNGLGPRQTAHLAGLRGVCSDGVGEIGSGGGSKRSAVSVLRYSAHDPLTQ